MKSLINSFFCFVLVASSVCAQNSKPPYFPQEQLIQKQCAASEKPNECLNGIVDSIIKTKFGKELIKKNWEKDTLRVSVRFSVKDNGKVSEDFFYVNLSEKLLEKNALDALKNSIKLLGPFEVLNRKPKEYRSEHHLNLGFVKRSAEGAIALNSVSLENRYEGGAINELPVFPGCENLKEDKRGECFNSKLRKHIRKEFQYPEEAQKNGIQGDVKITFFISKTGEITDIRTKASHPLLKEEAVRIVKLLPRIEPGKLNGKPVRVPFSFPMYFTIK